MTRGAGGPRSPDAAAGGGGGNVGGGPLRLAVLGDPLRHTRSPDLHRAGCAALGIACESVAVRTPAAALAATLERLAREGYTGCNLTMPLKEPALACVREASPEASRARSVNTVTFAPGGARGDTTDGAGFLDVLAVEGRDVASARVTLLGAGGSARSLALAICGAGGRAVRVVSRREPEAGEAWGGPLGERWAAWDSSAAERAFEAADVLVNCTPLGAGELPSPFQRLPRGALIVDLTYGPSVTPWVAAARSAGLDAVDGLLLLVHQARRSLAIWLGHAVPDIPLEPLLAAVRRAP